MELIRSSPIPIALGSQRFRHGHLFLGLFTYLQEGGEVYCLDAGNCFDPYPLAKMARSRGLPPDKVLENIRVSRAATCHQIVSVVEEMILPLAERPEGKIVLVLAIDSLFMDEDIPLFERKYLFDRILGGILKASGSLGCLITYNRGLEQDRLGRQWYGMLARRCRVGNGKAESWNRVEGTEDMENQIVKRFAPFHSFHDFHGVPRFKGEGISNETQIV